MTAGLPVPSSVSCLFVWLALFLHFSDFLLFCMLNFLFFFVPLPESLFVFLSDFQDKVSLYNPDSSETCSIAQADLCLWRVGIKGARHRHPALSFRVAFLPEYITLPLILPSFSQLRLSHFSLFIMLQGWGICAYGCSAFQSQSVPDAPEQESRDIGLCGC